MKLPEALREKVSRLSTPLNLKWISSLKDALTDFESSLVRSALRHPGLDMARAARLRKAAEALLDRYPQLDPPAQAWAAAAVKYFLMRDDDDNGFLSHTGFQDDLQVMDILLEATGQNDLRDLLREPAPKEESPGNVNTTP
jgi:hypothetical protein